MNSTKLFSEKLPIFEIKTINAFSQPLSNSTQVKELLSLEINNKMKILYFNSKIVHKYLYEINDTIKIDSKIIKNELSNCFYLALLLEENTDIVNYEYQIDLIREINNQLKNENKIRNIVASKIVNELIRNYKETDNYNEDEEKEELDDIENNNLYVIKNNLKELKMNDIGNKRIDEIYIDIINILIKTNKIDDYEYAYNIIKELDLEKIDLTELMFNELTQTLNINNKYIQKYKILDKEDFSFKKEIINFYYILFKYILKNSIYIYNIDLLFKTRQKIIKIIKNNNTDILYNNYIGDENKEKLEYIIHFIADLEYYNNVFLSESENNSISYNNSFAKSQSRNSINSSSTFNSTNLHKNSNSIRHVNISNDIIDNEFGVINFEKYLDIKNQKNFYCTFIKEMRNGTIIIGGSNDLMFFFNKKFDLIKSIKFDIISDKIGEKIEIMNCPNSQHQDKKQDKKDERIKYYKKTQNIFESSYREEDKNNNNIILINDCSKYALIQYKLIFDKNNNIIKISEPIKLLLPSTGYLEINVFGNDGYVVFGPKGIYQFNESPFNIHAEKDLENKLGKYNKNNTNFKAGIKINDNYIALTSNKISKSNGEDVFAIYDTRKKYITKKIGGSFVSGVNGIELIEIEKNNKKYLLCACKKYISGQENGITIIDADIKEKEDLIYKFYNTDDFEVNCFCQINIKNDDNKYEKTNYFFVGGFDTEKRCGIIKLYRIINDKIDNLEDFKIEYLQDIKVDIPDEFQTFGGTINIIIQSKTNGKILVSCFDGRIYCFSQPKIEYYLEDEKNDNVNG